MFWINIDFPTERKFLFDFIHKETIKRRKNQYNQVVILASRLNMNAWYFCVNYLIIFVILIFTPTYNFSDPVCVHCRTTFLPDPCLDIYSELINHCRTCAYMSRPDPYRFKYVCYGCSYFTYYVNNIRKHVTIHTGDKPFPCLQCDYKARESQALKIHVKRYHS